MPSDNVRNLMLGRVLKIAEQQNGGMKPNQSIVREATHLLDQRLNGGVALSDRDLRAVAIGAVKTADSNNSNLNGGGGGGAANASGAANNSISNSNTTSRIQRGGLASDIFNTNPSNRDGNLNSSAKVHHLPPMSGGSPTSVANNCSPSEYAGETNTSDLSSLIVNTSKRQRRILAEREWSKIAEEDRINGKLMTMKEKQDHMRAMAEQKAKLDAQKKELDERKEEERRMLERQKQQMNEHIEKHKQLTLREQQEARKKAMEERRVREQQHREASEARDRTRQQEHEEQVHRLMLLSEQERAQREADLNNKIKKQTEWREVLRQNEERTRDKILRKENERAEDREYQRKYKENQERLEAERAAFYARKDAKQKQHLALADRVAEQFQSKEKEHLDKIHNEYESQLRNDLEDEANRKRINKQKLAECLTFQQQQIAEKKRLEDERKAEEKRQAEEVRLQILENQRQEQARKMANHQEQLRMRQFLNTQLQMAHFKETQEPETSIMRPPQAAVNMFNTAALRSTSRTSNK